MKDLIIKEALKIGFDDAVFVSASPTENWEPTCELKNAASVLVLFSAYSPVSEREEGKINVSAYYPVSNKAYNNANKLCSFVDNLGINAILSTSCPQRLLAARTGGHFGKNEMYYHPIFGSYVHIQTIITSLECDFERSAPVFDSCDNCHICEKACPMGAIGKDMRLCMRDALNEYPIPESAAKHVYQLFGCERCQTACPKNPKVSGAPIRYNIDDLKAGTPESLKKLVGKNIARPRRVKAQLEAYLKNIKK